MSTEKVYKSSALFITQSINTVLSVFKILAKSKFTVKLPLSKSNKCIVLGNGPSLKQSLEKHYTIFKNSTLICVNTFAITDEYTKLQPEYYVMIDPSFWKGNNEAIDDTFKSLEEKTSWPLYLMVPYHAIKHDVFIRLQQKNKNIKITPFNYTVFKGFSGVAHWLYKKNMAMPQSLNVLIAAVFLSINIGFKEIILIGSDHTWHQNLHLSEENILYIKHEHFYTNELKISLTPLKTGINSDKTFRVDEIFAIWSKAFYGYIALEKYSKYKKCKIYNASEITFIDAFERLKL